MNGLKAFLSLSLVLVLVMFLPTILFDNESTGDVLIEVTTRQFRFTPEIINVTLGVEVTLRITSADVTHGFQLEEFDLFNIVIPAGETVDVTFVADHTGTFEFFCTVICGTGHSDHLGVLQVSE